MKRLLLFASLLFLAGCAAPAAEPVRGGVPVFGPSPRLATTPEELAAIKAAPDFAAVRDAAVKQADGLLANPVVLPEGYGSWIFYYACPDDGTDLHMLSLTEHQCPKCKKIYTDDRTVAAYRCKQHYDAENASVPLGWAYAYTGEDKYAQEVKRILLKLARDYPSYPQRTDRWGHTGALARLGGRRYVQSLDEAVGIIRLARAYDLTRNSQVWTPAEKELTEKNLFRLTAETLLQFNQGINNHQTWYNGGLMAIASVLGDAMLVDKVLTMPGGYYDQLERSIGADGLWYEGTMAYHNYALQAMFSIVDAGRRIGLPLHKEKKLHDMILGPLRAAYPNGQFPAINDSDPGSVSMFNAGFEWGWKTYREPIFAQALALGNPKKLAELLGPDAVAKSPMGTGTDNLSDAGLAILRLGEGVNAVCTFLDYGQHGEGHGHFDKLNLMLFANNREWLLDMGRLSYSHKEYKTWVKETAAHNTVSLGGVSQAGTTGKLLFLKSGDGFATCAAESDGAYPGSMLRRYLLLTPKMLLDVYDVEGTEKTQIDWFAHSISPVIRPVDIQAEGRAEALGDASGYQHLLEAKKWQADGDTRWDFVSDEKNADAPILRTWLAGKEREEVATAVGIGYYVTQRAPTLVRRRHAARTRFVTAFDLSGKGTYIQKVEVLPGNVAVLQVTTVDGVRRFQFTPAGVTSTAAG
jgi:hypothetical protein